MAFAVTPPDRDVKIRFIFFPHIVPGKVEKQRIQMTVNGVRVTEIVCTEKNAQSFEIVFPGRLFQTGKIEISFEFPDAAAPSEIGTGRDKRKLAMGIYSFIAELVDR